MKITQKNFTDYIIKKTLPILGAGAATAAAIHPNPTYNAIWVAVSTYLAMMQPNEREVFAKEFNKQNISEDILNSVSFIKATKAAIETTANTASKEKIKKVARLLSNASMNGLIEDFDMFKEYTKLINDISPQEFRILDIMKRNEAAYNSKSYQEYYEEVQDLESSWDQSNAQIRKELNASDRMVESYMLRLAGIGCIAPIGIAYPGTTKTIYRIAPLYVSLEDYIKQSV